MCDRKDSLIDCAESIWPLRARGGRIVFDDYADEEFAGPRLGIDYFVKKHGEEIAAHGMLNRLYHVVKK